jgi:hypothetical protein
VDKRLFHYTSSFRLKSIIGEGLIRQSTALVSAGERPVVWLSEEEEWEPTASTGLGWPVRIEVKRQAAPLGMDGFEKQSGVDPVIWQALVTVAKRNGANPFRWRASFDAISHNDWLTVEVKTKQGWKELVDWKGAIGYEIDFEDAA